MSQRIIKFIAALQLVILLLQIYFTSYIIKSNKIDTEPDLIYGIESITEYSTFSLPYVNKPNFSAKSYMDYRKITNQNSPQYDLIHNSGKITIDENGFLTDSEGYIGVAMGSYFGDIGNRFRLTLSDGSKLNVIIVERKDNRHTDNYNIRDLNGGMIELVIDTDKPFMKENIASNGLIFQGNFNNYNYFNGDIVKVEKII